MFEIGIFCIILLAVGYWVTLFAAGRREDVLHGQFVQAEAAPEPAAVPPPAKPPANAEALQSLLASIKRELKDAARM